MIAYFARRLMGGAVTLFLAGLLVYSLGMYLPGGIIAPPISTCRCTLDDRERLLEEQQKIDRLWEVDTPWPVNYIAWLFDPNETTETFFDWIGTNHDSYERREVNKGVNLMLGNLRLAGSGILTGDFGYSTDVDRGRPVLDMFGEGLGEFMLLLILTLPVSMVVVVVQRLRRPLVSGLPPNCPMDRSLSDRSLRPMRMLGL